MKPLAPHQIVCPDSTDRIVPPDELLATEAATIVAMQLTMLDLLAKRADVLRAKAVEAEFFVASEAAVTASGFFQSLGDGFKDCAVRLSGEARELAQEMDDAIAAMLDHIRPLAESVIVKNEAAIRAKSGKPAH